jgi:hypothetical protein
MNSGERMYFLLNFWNHFAGFDCLLFACRDAGDIFHSQNEPLPDVRFPKKYARANHLCREEAAGSARLNRKRVKIWQLVSAFESGSFTYTQSVQIRISIGGKKCSLNRPVKGDDGDNGRCWNDNPFFIPGLF